jgi:predicted CXXCH cytochrome family protein
MAAASIWFFRQRSAAGVLPLSSYVDASRCTSCHSDISHSYHQIGMAQTFSTIDGITPIEDYERNNQFFHSSSGRYYQMQRRGKQVFQRRYELDAKGRQVNVFEQEVTYAIGSGNHARTYLHRSESGELNELPVTWYTQEKRWDMSPGFDNANPADFTRLVDDRCLFCHNAYPAANGSLAQGIDCQRCHGPGSRHLELAASGNAAGQDIRAAIVNPARLSSERQMDVCMQCHLETTSTDLPSMLRRFDRAVNSFRPGEALTSYVVQFDEAPGTGRPEKFEIVNQAYRLRRSACFLKSAGKLTCTSCHNPHQAARGESAVRGYRKVCVGCHPRVTGPAHPGLQDSNCVTCHMPAQRTEDAVHVVMTDHFIQRRPASADRTRLSPENGVHAKGTPALYYPAQLPAEERDLYLGVALVTNAAARAQGIQMLEHQLNAKTPAKALAVLGEGYLAEGNASGAITMFRQALAKDAGLAKARYNLAEALAASGQIDEAVAEYNEAIRTQPGLAETEYALGNVLVKAGKPSDAVEHYRNAIRSRPTYPEAHNNLGNLYSEQRNLEKAEEELTEALRIDPGFAEAHNNLARVLASEHRLAEAMDHLRRAAALKPNFLEARYNLAKLLVESGSMDSAVEEYRRLIAIQPGFIAAHLSLGQALGDTGRLDAAIAEFQEVLHLQPDHAEARRNLEMALALKREGRR